MIDAAECEARADVCDCGVVATQWVD
jgi:hypothetical protein